MIDQSALSVRDPSEHQLAIDAERRAHWLQSVYFDPIWVVADTHNPKNLATIDFRFRLADGRLLVDADRLYGTVREYAWWVRDPRYSRIDSAVAHAVMVRNLMNVAHALSLRNIWSFAHLQPYDLELLVEDCRYGVDAVLHASERVNSYLKGLAAANMFHPMAFGGLPQAIRRDGRETRCVSTEQILAACNLPSNARVLPRVAALIAQAATANGMTSRYGRSPDELGPLPNATVQSLQRWLDPLEQLYAMRRRIEGESIEFKPFPVGAARVAAVKGVGVARTPIPPPRLALCLLERAACLISERDWLAAAGDPDRSHILQAATASWIIIAAFTARRDKEIDDLREGCLRGDFEAGWWLHVYIEKTLQRKEWIPVPGLVARAVEVMSAISESARRKTGTDQLFQWLCPDGNVTRLDVGRHLDDFAAIVNVPLHHPPGQSPIAWHWHPHQFRRFFAVLYYYRFEGATVEALSHYLRHFSLEMTRRYVTQDPEVAALWTDVEWGYMGDVARSIVSGERSVSGAAGERLKKTAKRLIDIFRRKLQIATPERVGASLTLIMQREGLVLTPKPWVTCTCPRTNDAAAKAACRQRSPISAGVAGPDFAHAGPSVCSFCPHAVTEGARKACVDREIANLEAAAQSKVRAGTVFGLLEEARMITLTQVRDSRYADASPIRGDVLDEEAKG
jgi:hypothetical protein